jgi:nucleotide-binding universal stress UspA family protein
MKHLNRILVPTDMSEHSRRALAYGSWLSGEDNATLTILHVTSDFHAWDFPSEDLPLPALGPKAWPADRVLAEASLDLSRFLESSMQDLTKAAVATKRVVIGPIAERIVAVAEEEKVDLIVMSPRQRRGLRHLLFGSITDTVTRNSPCPVLSIGPVRPSAPWRGELAPLFSPWSRRRAATI